MSSYYNNPKPSNYIRFIDTPSDSDEEQEDAQFTVDPNSTCIFCHAKLLYLLEKNQVQCPACGWGYERDFTSVLRYMQEQEEGGGGKKKKKRGSGSNIADSKPRTSGTRRSTTSSSSLSSPQPTTQEEEEQAIFPAFQLSRNEQIRNRLDPSSTDPFHKQLAKKGYTLIREIEHQPPGDANTERI